MENKELYENLIQIIREAGIPVVTDPQQIRDALDGQLMRDNLLDATIQKMIYSYEEGNDPPDLSPRRIDIEDKNGRPQKMYSVAFCGKRPKDYTPTKVGKAYKLMEQWPDGTLHALFAGTNKTYDLGKWNWAQGFTRDEQIGDMAKGLAPRYGWHMGTGVPATHHLMGVGDTLNPKMGYYSKTESGHPKGSKRVWVEVFYDASKDYTDVAEKNPSKSEKGICQQENPELWQQGVDLMKKTALWKAIEQSPAYQDIRSDDNLMASEVHARLATQQGTKILKKAIGNTSLAKKLKTWAKSYWNTVANCFNPKGKKEIKLQTAEDFAALPVKDLLSGKDLRQYLQTKNVR